MTCNVLASNHHLFSVNLTPSALEVLASNPIYSTGLKGVGPPEFRPAFGTLRWDAGLDFLLLVVLNPTIYLFKLLQPDTSLSAILGQA